MFNSNYAPNFYHFRDTVTFVKNHEYLKRTPPVFNVPIHILEHGTVPRKLE